MVFTTNTIAFAEEVTVDAVDETVEAEEVVVTLDADEDVVIDTDDAKKVTLSSNCFEWYVGDKDAENGEYLARYFLGWSEGWEAGGEENHFESEHYATDGKISISHNYGYKSEAHGPHYTDSSLASTYSYSPEQDEAKKWNYNKPVKAKFHDGVSSNVIKLDDNTFLFVAYSLGTTRMNKGTNIPVVPFNGMKYDASDKEPNNGKIKKSNYVIYAEAALVTQEAGKAPVLIANTESSNLVGKKYVPTMTVKITPKNNIYANVSRNQVKDEKGNNAGYPTIENPCLKEGQYPYFTVSVTIKADKNNKAQVEAAKVFKKNINKAEDQHGAKGLKKTEFKFDICQNSFAEFTYTNPNTGKDTISAADVQKFASEESYHYSGGVDPYYANEALGFRHLYPFPNFKDADNELGEDGDDEDHYYASRNYWIGQRTLYTEGDPNEPPYDGTAEIGTIDLFTDAKKAGKDNIPVYLVNATGEYDRVMNNAGWNRKKKFATYKLKKGKDYTVEKLEGVDNAIVLLPTGNFDPYSDGVIFRNAEYTLPAGYNDLKKEKKVTELRVGIYNTANKNFYVDSAE